MISWTDPFCILAGVVVLAGLLSRYVRFLEHHKDVGEGLIQKLFRIQMTHEMGALEYFICLLSLSILGGGWVLVLCLFQSHLPLNGGVVGLDWLQAGYVATTTAAHTNLQPIAPELLSPLTVLLGIGPINMLGGLIGFALWRAIVRAIARKGLGNAWGAIWRGILFLGPLQLLLGAVLVWQGVSQDPTGTTLPSTAVASFSAGSMVSASGTGIVSDGFASKLMNPTHRTDYSFLLALIAIPMGLWLAAGELIGRKALARNIAIGMGLLVSTATAITLFNMPPLPASTHSEVSQALWMNTTAACSNGGVNEPIERYGKAGILPAFMGLIGPLPFSPAMGFGTGLVLFSLAVALFMAALMTGKSPEFLGFSIHRSEVAAVLTTILGPPVAIFLAVGFVMNSSSCIDLIRTHGAHGVSAIIYFLTSAAQTNGSAYSLAIANPMILKVAMILMVVGRLLVVGPLLAFAGCLDRQRNTPAIKSAIEPNSLVVVIFFFVAAVFNAILTMSPLLMMGPILEVMG